MESAFTYQWQLDGANIAGATNLNISIADTSENGDYTVNAILAGYNETSNMLPVQLLTSETISISSNDTVFCGTSNPITLTTTTDLSVESFSWEKDGVSINTSDEGFIVPEPGEYALKISRAGCPITSNIITIESLNPDLITLDVEGDVIFPEGTSKTVTASGASTYQWFDQNNNLLNNSNQMTFTEEGTFILIANIDNCLVTRELTAVYLDVFNVPNVITPNGDGANDQWVLPNSYSYKSDVTVTIYNDKGVELVNQSNYANNWPQSSTTFAKQNMVFYYIIKNANEILKQGTITVIR